MPTRRAILSVLWLIVLCSIVGQASQARAQITCSSLQNPLYISGSSALEPLYKAIGKGLAQDPNNPITLVYQTPGSCTGIMALSQKTTTPFLYIDSTYDGVNVPTCVTSDVPSGISIDIALSDVFFENCNNGVLISAPNKDFLGPVEAMVFIVPSASSQTAITAEEAYYLFGFGKFGDAAPWTDENLICVRSSSSGTQRLLASTIRLPADRWKGKPNKASGDIVNCVGSAARVNAEKSIGILGTEVYDAGTLRNSLKALAFRGFRQYKAYYPDSTPTAFDKRNIRDGHYAAFGFSHFITAVDNMGKPLNPRVQAFLDIIQGNPQPRIDILTAIIKNAKLVPQCAMNVSRTTDGGDVVLSPSPTPCNCFFEATATGSAPASCKACTMDSMCASNHCRLGYCEAR